MLPIFTCFFRQRRCETRALPRATFTLHFVCSTFYRPTRHRAARARRPRSPARRARAHTRTHILLAKQQHRCFCLKQRRWSPPPLTRTHTRARFFLPYPLALRRRETSGGMERGSYRFAVVVVHQRAAGHPGDGVRAIHRSSAKMEKKKPCLSLSCPRCLPVLPLRGVVLSPRPSLLFFSSSSSRFNFSRICFDVELSPLRSRVAARAVFFPRSTIPSVAFYHMNEPRRAEYAK